MVQHLHTYSVLGECLYASSLRWPNKYLLGKHPCGKVLRARISLVDRMTSEKPGTLAQSNVLAHTKNKSALNN